MRLVKIYLAPENLAVEISYRLPEPVMNGSVTGVL